MQIRERSGERRVGAPITALLRAKMSFETKLNICRANVMRVGPNLRIDGPVVYAKSTC